MIVIIYYYKILSNLAGLVLALPHSSVEIERLFSQVKLIKTDKRVNLKEENLESLVLLKTSSIDIRNPAI